MDEKEFTIVLDKFYAGFSPAAHLNSLTELGGAGHASTMSNADVLDPTYLTQGPALSDLTNGNQSGAVSQLIAFILDRPPSDSVTYGIGTTKLFKITPTTVTSDGTWPHSITNATDGQSCIEFQGNLYYFFNKSSGADIGKYDLSSSFTDNWGSTVPTGAAALQKTPHPVAKKEDIMLFGNGRYVGTYISSTTTLAPTKLDFGANTEVADVLFNANQWWIAINTGVTTGTNRASGQIYLYDGSAVSSILADEVAVGVQKIGFIIAINGLVYVAYQDLSGSCALGYISGRRITDLCHWTGTLPTFAQKTLYKNFIAFLSSGLVYAAGAAISDLPYALSQHADGGYATVGAIAAPFGTPMVASTDGASNQRLAKFSGFDTASSWKNIVIPTLAGKMLAYIDWVIVLTKNLGANARCDLQLLYNQSQANSGSAKQITGANKRRHVFSSFENPTAGAEDLRVSLDWSNGNSTNDCAIRKIIVKGHYKEA